MVCLLEDEVRWMWGQRLYHEDELEGEVTNSEEFDQRVTIRDFGMNLSDVDKEKEIIGTDFFLVFSTTFNTVQSNLHMQSPVLRGHLFLVLLLKISYELNLL